jgi:hypothetical protein
MSAGGLETNGRTAFGSYCAGGPASRSPALVLSSVWLVLASGRRTLFSAVVRLLRNRNFLARLWRGLCIGNFHFNLLQHRYNLLRIVSLHRQVKLSFRVILSHFRWNKNPQSRHAFATYLKTDEHYI